MNDDQMPIVIRQALMDDLPAVHALAVAFYTEEDFATSADELRGHAASLIASTAALVLLAQADGRAAGLAVTTTSYGLEDGLIAELEDLYVVPELRSHGIARGLIKRSRDWAADQGCSQLEVVIDPGGAERHGLESFYARLGFVDHGRRLLTRPVSRDG